MMYNGKSGTSQSGRQGNTYNSSSQRSQNSVVPKKRTDFTDFDVVEEAEQAVLNLEKDNRGAIKLTTSQIRKFLTAVNTVKNKVDAYRMSGGSNALNDELAMEVKFLKVTLAYMTKERNVKDFAKKSKADEMIAWIGRDVKRFEKFCRYVEALVAYHKYHGGRDK